MPINASEPRYEFCTSRPQSGDDLGLEILVPLSLDRKAYVEDCKFALSTFTFEIQDPGGIATALLTNNLVGYRCDLYAGFWDLDWEDNRIVLFIGILSEMEHEERRYKFIARSPMAAATDKILFAGAATRLVDTVNDTATTFHVEDASDFEPNSTGSLGRRTVQVGDNDSARLYDFYGRGELGDGTWNISSLVRTQPYLVPPFTTGAAIGHDADSPVHEVPYIEQSHPATVFSNVIQAYDGKRGIAGSGVFVISGNQASATDQLGEDVRFQFLFRDSLSAKRFLEEEICLPCAAYPIENNAGFVGLKVFPAAGAVGDDTLGDADIIQRPQWLRNAQRIVTTVIYHYDYMPTTDKYLGIYTYRDQGLINAIGREITIEIFSKGIRSLYDETATFLQERARAHVDRFKLGAPVITLVASWRKSLLELGDDVRTNFSDIPNLPAGTIGVTSAPAEIVGTRHRFLDGVVELELLSVPPTIIGFEEPTAWAITNNPFINAGTSFIAAAAAICSSGATVTGVSVVGTHYIFRQAQFHRQRRKPKLPRTFENYNNWEIINPFATPTIYVTKSGNDANDGLTIGNAKLTINGGLAVVMPGGTVAVGDGIYDEGIHSDQIPFGLDNEHHTIIKAINRGAVTVTGINADDSIIKIKAAQYITIDGINVDAAALNYGTPGFSAFAVEIGGDNASPSAGSSYIKYQYATILGSANRGCISSHGYPGGSSHHITLSHLTCDGTAAGRATGSNNLHCVYMWAADLVVEFCTIFNAAHAGIVLYASGTSGIDRARLVANRIYDCDLGIGVGAGGDQLVANNMVFNCGIGFYSAADSSDVRIYNDTFYANSAQSVWNDGGANVQAKNLICYLNGVDTLTGSYSSTATNLLGIDPSFVNSGAGNFHLQSGSVARTGGTTITEIAADLDNIVRPQGATYSRGCYEFV